MPNRPIESDAAGRRPALTWPADGASELVTRDPASGRELIVTRLEGPGVVLEGQFRLGWLGKLTGDQIAFVGLLAFYRGNVQKVAAHLGLSYNTGRSRLDDIATAIAAPPPAENRILAILDRLGNDEIDFREAVQLIQGL